MDLRCNCCQTRLGYGMISTLASYMNGIPISGYGKNEDVEITMLCTECVQSGLARRRGYRISKLAGRIVETGITLPGWTCKCGAFNGALKEWLLECRMCNQPGPNPPASKVELDVAE